MKSVTASINAIRERLSMGLAIPASPLALNGQRKLDERRQRALCRYYLAAGAGGLAVGVHTTQFAIRDARVGLFKPVLELAAEEMTRVESRVDESGFPVRIAGICGTTPQATTEATLARGLGYHAGLLSLGALSAASEEEVLDHCRAVGEIIPLFGFYLQPAVGGRLLPHSFWRGLADIKNLVAVKIAPFNRYQTLDVVRAMTEAGRDDVALYTGNDDQIVLDLLTPYRFRVGERRVERRIVGGLLGHWAVWSRRAVALHAECRRLAIRGAAILPEHLQQAVEITDCNAAFFDAAHHFAGCIPGLHEVLRRQGLLEGIWCLNPNEVLSPGQSEEIDRVYRAYPHLNDDEFVAEHRDQWLAG
jgi:dihydrodipicolinate synthase/N-acetylneuraminate lyase